MAPWGFLWLGLRALLGYLWPPGGGIGDARWWVWATTADLSLVLPFLLFAAGVALASILQYRRGLLRVTILFAIVLAAVSYCLEAWVSPTLRDRALSTSATAPVEARRFGPRTPVGLLRNLRYVEENPPDEYALRIDAPQLVPPNVLRWRLHYPLAHAVFGLLNVILGILSAQVTGDLARGMRRNLRLSIGIVGGTAFFSLRVVASPVQPFLQDGVMQSGILGAWAPLMLPLIEILVLSQVLRARSR